MSQASARFSSKPQTELDRIRLQLSKLRVGEQTEIRPKLRTDWENYWTRLATWAVGEIWNTTRPVTHLLLCHAKRAGAEACPLSLEIFGTKLEGKAYSIPERRMFNQLVVAEWENASLKLTAPVRKDNLKDWQRLVTEFVRESFVRSKVLYDEALAKNGQSSLPKYERRNMALGRVRQALGRLAGA